MHSGTIIFEFLVLEIFELGEVPDVVVHFVHFVVGKTEEGAVHIDVFAAGELRVKPNAKFDKRYKCAVDGDLAFFGIIDAGEDFEQG